MKIVVALAALSISACSSPIKTENVPGQYVSDGEFSEALTLRPDGTYTHTWNQSGAQSEDGAWSFREKNEDCPKLTLTNFTVLPRYGRGIRQMDTYVVCVDVTIRGQMYLVFNSDAGLYLEKFDGV